MIRTLISIPLIVVLIAFALSNQQPVRVGIWPTDIQVDVPLSVAVLVAAALFFVVGAFMTWTGLVAMRGRARRAERHARELQAQLESMRQTHIEHLRAHQAPSSSREVALLPPG